VAIDVEEAQQLTARLDPQARQLRAQLLGLVITGQARELAS